MKPTLFNIDALFELICGLIFLFNPLLGPALPVSSGLVSALGIALLVSTIFLGKAGLGKGPLVNRLSTVAAVNLVSGLILVAWSITDDSFSPSASMFVRVVAGLLVALGVAQLALGRRGPKVRPNRSTQAQRLEAIRRSQGK